MGEVIRMNMAARLVGLSRAQAAVRNRCQLTHICNACWDIGAPARGYAASGAPKDCFRKCPPKAARLCATFFLPGRISSSFFVNYKSSINSNQLSNLVLQGYIFTLL